MMNKISMYFCIVATLLISGGKAYAVTKVGEIVSASPHTTEKPHKTIESVSSPSKTDKEEKNKQAETKQKAVEAKAPTVTKPQPLKVEEKKKEVTPKPIEVQKDVASKKVTPTPTKTVVNIGLEAEKFIQDLGDQAIEKLTGKELTRQERNKKFEGLFVKAFDYEKIGKFVLGRGRRDAKPAEMEEYLKLFKSTIVSTYAARFGEYHEEKFKVQSNKVVSKDVDTLIVASQIIRPDGSKIAIEWHLYQDKNKELKIFDVVVEGVSMALTQRSEFNAILQREGSLGGLNDVLRRRQA